MRWVVVLVVAAAGLFTLSLVVFALLFAAGKPSHEHGTGKLRTTTSR